MLFHSARNSTGKAHACIWENVCKYQAFLELEQKPALLFLGQNKQSKSFSLNNIFCCLLYFFSESLCSRRVTFLEKIMLNCYLTYDVKVYFNWINILYIKNKIVKELEENVGSFKSLRISLFDTRNKIQKRKQSWEI